MLPDTKLPLRKARRLRWVRSFHGRSILATAAVSLLAWLGSAIWLIADAGRERHDVVDAELREAAAIVMTGLPLPSPAQLAPTVFEIPSEPVRKDARSLELSEFNFQAWNRQRRLLSRTSTTPTEPLNASFQAGFSSQTMAGERWRVYSLDDLERGLQVQVGKRQSLRALAARREALEELRDLLVLLLGLTVAQAGAILWTAAPLRRLRAQVEARRPADTQALPTDELPAEVLPLVESFNQLMTRADAARRAQQRFVADAAHELRTPLAVLRLQAQAALRSPAEERDTALLRLQAGIDRAGRVVEQLLALAHLEAQPGAGAGKPVRLDQLTNEVLELVAPQAARRGIRLQAQLPTMEARTQPELLHIALRNVLDNAIRYSPRGSTVEISLTDDEGRPVLAVVDQGPGLTDPQKFAALQPFVRLHEGPETGSGLGLAIVQRVAEHLGARLVLRDAKPGPGLAAVLVLPVQENLLEESSQV